MMKIIRHYIDFQSNYSKLRWDWLKIPFIILWFILFSVTLFRLSHIITPLGICRLVDCSIFLSSTVKISLFIIAFVACAFYVLEKKMVFVIGVLTAISILVFTMEDSHGILNRRDILSGILLAQFIAYFLHAIKPSSNINKNRIFYSQQIIIAAYFLSGLSKLINSGWQWFNNPQGFLLQVQKANWNKYIDLMNPDYLVKADCRTTFIIEYPTLIIFLLLLTFLLELSAFVTLFLKPKWMIIYGVLFIGMHIGIWYFMSISIDSVIGVNLIFLLNIFYFLYLPFKKKDLNLSSST